MILNVTSTMSQREMIYEYMVENGSISQKEATDELGITKLATRISEMKSRDGIGIESEVEHRKNRWGKMTHYCRYRLHNEKDTK